jgi:hypothetical protein
MQFCMGVSANKVGVRQRIFSILEVCYFGGSTLSVDWGALCCFWD